MDRRGSQGNAESGKAVVGRDGAWQAWRSMGWRALVGWGTAGLGLAGKAVKARLVGVGVARNGRLG